jgi:transposase-like protein/negative regulator of genetic competence, sporulation and motility
MLTPPFCPNSDCRNHTSLPPRKRWYHIAGRYETKVSGTIVRFKCLACGKTFSEQTFRLDYYVKKKLSYQRIFEHITNCGGLRATARIMGVNAQSISNRLGRLARQGMALQAELLSGFTPGEDLVTDGFESFVSDQYQPNNIHLLVGKSSQFLFTYDYSHLKRKGRMSAFQKAERERRERENIRERRSISQSFGEIADVVEEYALRREGEAPCLYSDEKKEYAQVLAGSQALQELRERGLFHHLTISSELKRTIHNPLFAVNYYDRELRKDNADHVRETVRFSRNVNNALERTAVYQMYHNFFKPFRVADKELKDFTHAEMAGIRREWMQQSMRELFSIRKFFSHVKLNWSQMLVWSRLTGNLDRFDGVYFPAYVWM